MAESSLHHQDIVRARRENPCATLQVIGDRFGVSRERIRQILSEEGEPTRGYHQTYLCIQCGQNLGTRKILFCNKKCKHDYSFTQIACSYCGNLREYRISHLMWQIENRGRSTRLFFCSKEHQGKYLAREHGFIAHPENSGGASFKWDYSKVYELRDRTGWGALRIGRALGIPMSTVDGILSKRKTP